MSTNRIAEAWQTRVKLPAPCPICGKMIPQSARPPAWEIPLIVQRSNRDGSDHQEVALHAGCQAACTTEEMKEIR